MTMKKPIIGITPSHNKQSEEIEMRFTYLRAIANAGAIPIPLPIEGSTEDRRQLVETCDGFLFSGGPDVHPFLYHEDTHINCGDISELRDSLEMELFKLAMEAQKPILGICRGIQAINVFLGGDLYQDLPSQLKSSFPIAHRQPYYYTTPSHYVDVVAGTRMAQIAEGQPQIAVNSMHHQGLRTLAPGLTATAFSKDGLIEAVEKSDYPYLVGVQWHPEFLCAEDGPAKNLFASFVEACRK